MGLLYNLLKWRRKRHEVKWDPILSPGEKIIARIAVGLDLNRFSFRYEYLDDRIAIVTNKRIIWKIWNSKTDNMTEEIRYTSILKVDSNKVSLTGIGWQKMGGDYIAILIKNSLPLGADEREEDKTINVYLLFRKKSHADRMRVIFKNILKDPK